MNLRTRREQSALLVSNCLSLMVIAPAEMP